MRFDMKRLSLSVLVAVVAVTLCACGADTAQKAAASPSPAASPSSGMNDHDKTVYALGLMLGRNLEPLGLAPAEIEIVKKGLTDAATGQKPEVDLQVYGPKIEELARTRAADRAKGEKDKSKAFGVSAAKEKGAVQTPSGLVFRTITPGNGPSPGATDTVKCHYTGTLVDGKKFDSSVDRGQPAEFSLGEVIPCWTEGIQRMKVGEKARLVCPSEIAYGDQGRPPVIPGGATLIFDVELLGIKKGAAPPDRRGS
jgi:FKBP-type peptidyl-prolyl cis-trans isomerase FkpA